MMHKNKVRGMKLQEDFIKKKFEQCNICQRNRGICMSTRLRMVNDNLSLRGLLRMDYISLVEGKSLLLKVDFLSRLVQVDVVHKVSAKSTLRGLKKWKHTYGGMGN